MVISDGIFLMSGPTLSVSGGLFLEEEMFRGLSRLHTALKGESRRRKD